MANRLKLRAKLLLISLPLAFSAFVGMSFIVSEAISHRSHVNYLKQANIVSSYILQAVGEQAKERGFTITSLLSLKDEQIRLQIPQIRSAGDIALDSAITVSTEFIQNNSTSQTNLDKIRLLRSQRDSLRKEIDVFVGQRKGNDEIINSWINTQTQMIAVEMQFMQILFSTEHSIESALEFYGILKSKLYDASEYAGRERANIAAILASGNKIQPAKYEMLMNYRGVVENALAAIQGHRENPHVTADIRNAIATAEREFLVTFEQTRKQVYFAGLNNKPYPMTTAEWIDISTKAINTLLGLSISINQEISTVANREYEEVKTKLIFVAFGLLITTGIVILAQFVSADVKKSFSLLAKTAEEFGKGNYSTRAQSLGSDEISDLAARFNIMAEQVEDAVRQIQLERKRAEDALFDVEKSQLLSEQQRKILEEQALLITEQNTSLVIKNAEVEQALLMLKEADKFKMKILGIASHDLKNPITGFNLMIDNLSKLIVKVPQTEKILGMMSQVANQMLNIVISLIDVAARELGKIKLAINTFDMTALVQEVVNSNTPHAHQKRQFIHYLPKDDCIVNGDKERLRQVLDNLISNAIKYSEFDKNIYIKVDKSDQQVIICVKDEGQGMSKEDLRHLYEDFHTLSAYPTGGESSTGLGLSTVKNLVSLHGGKVWAESEGKGKGSIFYISLPILFDSNPSN